MVAKLNRSHISILKNYLLLHKHHLHSNRNNHHLHFINVVGSFDNLYGTKFGNHVFASAEDSSILLGNPAMSCLTLTIKCLILPFPLMLFVLL